MKNLLSSVSIIALASVLENYERIEAMRPAHGA